MMKNSFKTSNFLVASKEKPPLLWMTGLEPVLFAVFLGVQDLSNKMEVLLSV